MKKMIMFYRSKDDSQKIASSAINKIKSYNLQDKIDLEIINLEKRNYVKLLSKLEDIKNIKVYACDDEENLMDHISDNYKELEIETYNIQNAIDKGYKTYNYSYLGEKIINDFKCSFGEVKLWYVEKNYLGETSYEIKTKTISQYDYDISWEYKDRTSKYFLKEEDAKESLILMLMNNIKRKKSNITELKKEIKEQEAMLQKLLK